MCGETLFVSLDAYPVIVLHCKVDEKFSHGCALHGVVPDVGEHVFGEAVPLCADLEERVHGYIAEIGDTACVAEDVDFADESGRERDSAVGIEVEVKLAAIEPVEECCKDFRVVVQKIDLVVGVFEPAVFERVLEVRRVVGK